MAAYYIAYAFTHFTFTLCHLGHSGLPATTALDLENLLNCKLQIWNQIPDSDQFFFLNAQTAREHYNINYI